MEKQSLLGLLVMVSVFMFHLSVLLIPSNLNGSVMVMGFLDNVHREGGVLEVHTEFLCFKLRLFRRHQVTAWATYAWYWSSLMLVVNPLMVVLYACYGDWWYIRFFSI